MQTILLNKNFESIDIIDYFNSFIWSDRFCDAGDVELYIGTNYQKVNQILKDYYLVFDESEHGMIIEEKEIQTDPENGSYWIITGRSFESILYRRIIWNKTTISGNLQTAIKKLINENIINPSISNRKISNFIFKDSTDSAITSLTIDTLEYQGEYLFDVVQKICSDKKIGFKVTLNTSNQFVFQLYAGIDRSYEQEANPYVVFSPRFDNLVNSSFYESCKDYKNVVLVAGSKGSDAKTYRSVGSGSGIERRETYLDTSVDQDVSNINSYLDQKGNEELNNNKIKEVVDAEIDTTRMYVYNEDFFLGDSVQVEDEYGNSKKGRLEEMVYSQDDQNGETRIPTFNTNF